MNKRIRRSLAPLALAAAVAGGVFGGNALFNRAQFAHAQEQVDLSRQQLQRVDDLASAFRAVGKAVEPSVVNIQVKKAVKGGGQRQMPLDEDMLRRFFPDRDGDGQPDLPEGFGGGGNGDEDGGSSSEPFEQGQGSGVVMDVVKGEAFILTNNHVAGGATEMVVTLNDGKEVRDAKLVGADPKSDLAVVKIPYDKVIPAKWGDSDKLEKGDIVMAFGSPFGYVGSMTQGIVSALNRQARILSGPFAYENFIQTDCAINPGNSGGPLVNLRGEVIGINTAIASRTGGFEGIGFAIPAAQAKQVYGQLREKGKVTRGWLGVSIGDIGKDNRVRDAARSVGYEGETGVLVTETINGTPAYGKLQPRDVVTAINGKAVKTVDELRSTIAMTTPNSDVKLTVIRDGKEQEVTVTIGEQPDDLASATNGRGNRGNNRRGGEAETASAQSLGLRLSNPTEQQLEKYGLNDTKGGAIITNITPGSPAQQAGLRVGDLVTRVADKDITSAKDVTDALGKADLKKGVALNVNNRDGTRFVFLKSDK